MNGNSYNIIECFIKVAPYLNELTIRDVAVAVSDREKYLYYVPGNELNHGVKPNDPVRKGTLIERAMESGQQIINYVGKELFGFPYIGIAIPLNDETTGEVVGGVFFGENTNEYDTLRGMAKELSGNTNEVNESIQQINAEAQELAALGQQLSKIALDFNEQLKDVDSAIELIRNIAKQTNLLGLNAAIESARVGEAGKGFQVVAEEIRKLSTTSNDSVNRIQNTLKRIQSGSLEIKENIDNVENISSNVATILQNIAISIDGVNTMVEELYNLSNDLINNGGK